MYSSDHFLSQKHSIKNNGKCRNSSYFHQQPSASAEYSCGEPAIPKESIGTSPMKFGNYDDGPRLTPDSPSYFENDKNSLVDPSEGILNSININTINFNIINVN